ncbi:hypothetical protein HD554DRAFT_2042774 [Boletus coccyginus]|nr:hypothetical protein HD554DRAFT_2042774 [Boletus coccyginus]
MLPPNPTLYSAYQESYRSINIQAKRGLVDPAQSPATLRLERFKNWSPEDLRELLESNSGHLTQEVLQSKLQSHVFHSMPIRVIKLPEMELMERSEVASYLIKTRVEDDGDMAIHRATVADTAQSYYPGKEMQDRAISKWLQRVARFAVLSHTWQEEEPGYKAFKGQRESDRKGKKTLRGYRKLQRFCDIAHWVFGVEFAWADTKPLYLLDCPSDRWFTRGWILQEILAPHRLKFYNKDWCPLTNFLNDKIEYFDEEWLKNRGQINPDSSYSHQFHLLHHAIFMATGLDMTTICHFRPGIHGPSLPERMKWVARRVTTRPEDKAYCMMGIFGVSISIAYGEGAQRAFFRLFSAILEIGYSRDWFIWGGKPILWEIHPSRMIPSSPECYLARVDIGKKDFMSMNPREGELVTLTNLGLPMKMLVVPVRVDYNQDLSTFYQPSDIRISCPVSDEPVVVQSMTSDWDGENEGMVQSPQFALGILNIVSPEMMDTPKHLCAILLRRPVQESRSTAEPKWTYSKWEKRETNKALVFQRSEKFPRMNGDSWNGITISRSAVGWSRKGDDPKIRLQTLYL